MRCINQLQHVESNVSTIQLTSDPYPEILRINGNKAMSKKAFLNKISKKRRSTRLLSKTTNANNAIE